MKTFGIINWNDNIVINNIAMKAVDYKIRSTIFNKLL